jgi:hypothetical protein
MSTRKPDTNPTNTERLKMAQLLLRGIRGVEPGESSGFTEILAPYFGKRVKPKAGVTPPSPRRVVIAPDEDPIPPARVEYVPQQGREWINRTQGQHLYTQATTEEEIPSRRAGRISLPNPTRSLRLPNFHGLWFLYALAFIVVLVIAVNVIISISVFSSDLITTIRYGNPRTTHLEAFVGFNGETSASPTEITAVNLHGVANIYIMPAGKASGGFILQQTLAEDTEGKSPIYLDLFDCDRDGHTDLIVSLNGGSSFVYLLDTGKQQFRIPNAEEQARLILPAISH